MSDQKAEAMRRLQIRRKGILPFLVLGLVIVAAQCSAAARSTPLRGALQSAGLILIGLAITGRGWCSLYIGGRKKAEIMDQGPHSVSRNPLYVFSIIAAFGVGAQSGSLVLAATFALAAILVFPATVRCEEAWLLGAPYADYLRRTPRFWPDPRCGGRETRWGSAPDSSSRPWGMVSPCYWPCLSSRCWIRSSAPA